MGDWFKNPCSYRRTMWLPGVTEIHVTSARTSTHAARAGQCRQDSLNTIPLARIKV